MSISQDASSGNYLRTWFAPNFNGIYTATCWLKVPTLNDQYHAFWLENAAGDRDRVSTDPQTPFHHIGVECVYSGSDWQVGAGTISAATWFFVAARRTGVTSLNLRLGLSPYTATTSEATSTKDVTGRDTSDKIVLGNTAVSKPCSYAQLRMWTVALTDEQIITEMQSPTVVKADGDLWDEWRLLDLTTAHDSRTGTHDMDVNGTGWTTGADDPPQGGGTGIIVSAAYNVTP